MFPTRYDLVYSLALPALLPYLGYRRLRRGKYRQSASGMLGQDLPAPADRRIFERGSVWIHAVSVGETVAAKSIAPLVRQLLPELPLVASTITETGQAHARKILTEAAHIHYFPLDFSWNTRRFLDCYNPRVILVMETEIWPNFLTLAAERGARIFMVNGKLSDKSFKGYSKGRGFLAPAFNAFHAFCMQTQQTQTAWPHSANAPGRPCHRQLQIRHAGLTLSPEQQEALRTRYRLGTRRPTVVVGSTHPGEEEIVLEAFRQTRQSVPNLLLILSPRHPERFNEIFTLCQRHPANWRVSRATDPQTDAPDIFLLDTMGELARTYGLGDLGVVAGSFGNIGGHNLLEAAVHSIPVLVGPNMHAQKEIDRLFSGAEAVVCDVAPKHSARSGPICSRTLRNASNRRTGTCNRNPQPGQRSSQHRGHPSLPARRSSLTDNTMTRPEPAQPPLLPFLWSA
jgi:3-deoxy-D-manno-octulosonic-acid transferase